MVEHFLVTFLFLLSTFIQDECFLSWSSLGPYPVHWGDLYANLQRRSYVTRWKQHGSILENIFDKMVSWVFSCMNSNKFSMKVYFSMITSLFERERNWTKVIYVHAILKKYHLFLYVLHVYIGISNIVKFKLKIKTTFIKI